MKEEIGPRLSRVVLASVVVVRGLKGCILLAVLLLFVVVVGWFCVPHASACLSLSRCCWLLLLLLRLFASALLLLLGTTGEKPMARLPRFLHSWQGCH